MDDYYTEGWAALRQCVLDGQHILNCGADITVPQGNGGSAEQDKAELKQSVYPPLRSFAPYPRLLDEAVIANSPAQLCTETTANDHQT
jgi:hypothetical protein